MTAPEEPLDSARDRVAERARRYVATDGGGRPGATREPEAVGWRFCLPA